MKQLIEDLISAMEYHVEQTRPIHSTTVALQAAKDALKAMPTHLACDCYQGQVCHVCDPITPPAQPAPVPLTDWVSVDDRLPDSGGYYLVTVDTDDGPHVDVLMYNAKRKHWEHEGEPTFCHSYLFSPTHWAARPEAAHGITKGQP